MKIIRSIEELGTLNGPVHIAIGVFDGVHRGHQEVIRSATDAAAKDGGTTVVLTFDPHPAVVLRPDKAPSVLTSTPTKTRLLAGLGVDALLLHPFDMEFAGCPAREFIESLVIKCTPLAQISVGWDWTFGRNREGDTTMLKVLGDEFGFVATVIDPVHFGKVIISSTAIRAAVGTGDVRLVSDLLGRDHSVKATVTEGRKLGHQLGFPTANLAIAGVEVRLPPNGVYAVRVDCLEGDSELQGLDGVANIGVKPTIGANEARVLEVHLFEFSGDLYGKEMRVGFVERLREERKFDSLDALKTQIGADLEEAKLALEGAGVSTPESEAEKEPTFQ